MSGPARILVADDEPLARARLRALLAELGAGEVVGEAASGLEAIELALRERPAVVLLDIRMPGMDGLEAARHLATLDPAPAVIFTTAYDSHALAAFEANAVDYLLKPIRPERLRAALDKAAALTAARAGVLDRAARAAPRARTHFSAPAKGGLRLVPVADVRYLQAGQGYVSVFHPGGELLVEESLRALEEEFGAVFLRIHRNTLVAVAHVTALRRTLAGADVVLRDVPAPLPVSRRLLPNVRRTLRLI